MPPPEKGRMGNDRRTQTSATRECGRMEAVDAGAVVGAASKRVGRAAGASSCWRASHNERPAEGRSGVQGPASWPQRFNCCTSLLQRKRVSHGSFFGEEI